MKESAGVLLFRQTGRDWEDVEILLVHPSGNYNRQAPWSIPKGEPNEGEADLAAVARRECLEETGVVAGALVSLGTVTYRKSRKRIHAFAGPAPVNAMPHAACWEVDQCRFMPVAEAEARLHPDQREFVARLREMWAKDGLPFSGKR